MNSTRPLRCLAAALLAATALFAQDPPPPRRGPGMGPMMGDRGLGPVNSSPITGAPYSGVQTLQTQQNLANGIVIQNQQQTKVYRDSKGRTRTESSMAQPSGGPSETFITIHDPAANTMIRLDPRTSTAYKSQRPFGGPMDHGGGPPPRGEMNLPPQTTDLGAKTINGLPATGTRVTITIPTGAIGNNQPIPVVRETWISTDLKVPLLITSSDPRFGTSTMQLSNIVRAEPDASLFTVPPDYTVVNDNGPNHRGGPRGPGGPPDGERRPHGPGRPPGGPDDRRPPRFDHE